MAAPETPEIPPEAAVAHDSPGRLRLKLPAQRGDTVFFARLGTELAHAPAVESVETNATTASVLIRHASDRQTLLDWAQGRDLLRPAERPFSPYPGPSSAEPDWRLVLAALIGVLAVVQLLRGQVLAPAVTLAFMAAQVARLPFVGGTDTGGEASGEGGA